MNDLTKSLASKVAVVTGASSGLGKAIAAALEESGATVVRWDRESCDAPRSFRVDVTQAEAVGAAAKSVVSEFGSVNVLVNSAGIAEVRPWGRIDEQHFQRVFGVNVLGMALTIQALGPHMPTNSSIINLASGAGRKGNPLSVMYAASKSAVISLTQSAAIAFAGDGIRINAIAPGRVDSKMWEMVVRQQAELSGSPESQIRLGETNGITLRRLGRIQEIVAPVLFLAGAGSEYMTGQTINVDGGMYFG